VSVDDCSDDQRHLHRGWNLRAGLRPHHHGGEREDRKMDIVVSASCLVVEEANDRFAPSVNNARHSFMTGNPFDAKTGSMLV
jgi:hypothetical protein